MTHRLVALVLFTLAAPAFAQNGPANSGNAPTSNAPTTNAPVANAPAAPAAEPDGGKADAAYMLESLKAEGKAMAQLAGSIKAEVKAGRVKVSKGAQGRWESGKAMWEEVKALGEAGKHKEAYAKMRELRQLFGETLGVAFSGKVSDTVRDDFHAWWKVAKERAEHIVEYGKTHELSDAVKADYATGKAHWEEAKASAEAKNYAQAFTSMLKGLAALDMVMWNVKQGN
jgi:hypothetical protein